MKFQFASAFLLIFVSACVSAMPVTLQSTWSFYGPNVTAGLASLTLTYDDSTPDTNPDAKLGYYADPLLALTLATPDKLYSLNAHTDNSIDLRVAGYNYFHLMAGLVSDSGELVDLDIFMEAIDTLVNDTLENFKNDARRSNLDENLLKLIAADGHDTAHGRVVNQFIEVPEPGTVGLALAGLLVASIFCRRK